MAFRSLAVRKVAPETLTQDTPSVCVCTLKPFGLGRSLLLRLESAVPLCQAHTWNTWLMDGGAICVSGRIFRTQVADVSHEA